MKPKTIIYLLVFIGQTINGYSQFDSLDLKESINYDARFFLTQTQIVSFNKLYSDFDSIKVEKNWEWIDVDPLGVFSQEENRAKRRELFLFEHNPYLMRDNEPSVEQVAYKILIEKRISESKIFIDNYNAKICFPFTNKYEKFSLGGLHSLLEKLSELGFEWAQAGGTNLYIYNGNILLGKYKSGYVSFANLNIDRPNSNYKSK